MSLDKVKGGLGNAPGEEAARQTQSDQSTPSTTATSPSEADRPDHRTIATEHELFTVSEFSPGSPLILPNGTHVLNKLIIFLRAQYLQYGFREVLTPNIYKKSLWQISGHWQNYKDDMYAVFPGTDGAGGHDNETGAADGHETLIDEEDREGYGLKPMNCPGHCLLMRSKRHTYKEMPVRYADFSALHRNEVSGSLSGLTRVRRFHQDDAHIFCRPHQITSEIEAQLKFTETVLNVFKLKDYRLALSTRPEKDFIGTIDMWDDAEHQLTQALDNAGKTWTVNQGDGAFYGPKIDLQLMDSDGKYHQLSTIQLDMNLPKRFGIGYVTVPGEPDYDAPAPYEGPYFKTPVLIHRAIFGSLERFFAILIEHYNTRWPFWLSFRQGIILTVNDGKKLNQAAKEAASQMSGFASGPGDVALSPTIPTFKIDINGDSNTLAKKIVSAKKKKYNFIFVLGQKNLQDGTVDVDFSGQAATKGFQGMEKFLEGLDVVSFNADAKRMKVKTKDVYGLFLRLERAFQ
ncbi:hypothetical protein KEM56_006394 [Ascosphaera pollenicola]|nr:hypothetical protein KEM56_006394 [Ascosphaera pollenicola]